MIVRAGSVRGIDVDAMMKIENIGKDGDYIVVLKS
jgi:hypothetical protein